MKIQTIRNDGHEEHDLGTQQRSPEDGVYSILKYELGFGGRVISMDESRVTLRTNVMGKVDTVIVTLETKEERQLMFTMLHHWHDASKEVDGNKELIQILCEKLEGNPLLITHGLPVFLGEHKIRRTMLLCLGLADKPEVVTALRGHDDASMVAIAELVSEGHTWEEALEVLQ